MVQLLIENGADVNLVDYEDSTALVLAEKQFQKKGSEVFKQIVTIIRSAILVDDIMTGKSDFTPVGDTENLNVDFELVKSRCKIAIYNKAKISINNHNVKNIELNPYLSEVDKTELLTHNQEITFKMVRYVSDLYHLDGNRDKSELKSLRDAKKTTIEDDPSVLVAEEIKSNNSERKTNILAIIPDDIMKSSSGLRIISELIASEKAAWAIEPKGHNIDASHEEDSSLIGQAAEEGSPID
jgi:hypothetical protein